VAAPVETVSAEPVKQRVAASVQRMVAARPAVVSAPGEQEVEQKVEQKVVAKLTTPEQTAPPLDPKARRERLKQRLKAATAPVQTTVPTPQNPAEARASALALVAQLRKELEDAHRINAALTRDLEQARLEQARAAEE